ncbi:MAG: hypothetical protein DRJ42_00785 [Deltaproteobacteria bacterium]|nr:MAG: hypothetical protein DRJ42_00785 [Deltaproteobacteria bacterium]
MAERRNGSDFLRFHGPVSLTLGIFSMLLVLVATACNPLEFDDLANAASTRVIPRASGFTSRDPFGSVLEGYVVSVGGAAAESRLAVGAGPGTPVVIYRGWANGDFDLAAPLSDTCDDPGDCLDSAGAALIGIPRWPLSGIETLEGCLMATAPAEGGFSMICESDPNIRSLGGAPADVALGTSGDAVAPGLDLGVAILGAPRANSGAGGVYRVEGAMIVEIVLPPGTAPSASHLGTDLDVADGTSGTSARVAVTAPDGGRVVVFTVASDGTATVDACIDDPALGFAGSVAYGDVDGDGAPDVIVGNAGEGADEVRVYASSAAPVGGGCMAWGAAPTIVTCPDVDPGVVCAGSNFGVDVSVGDLDGDGIGDLVVGAPAAVVAGIERAGAVFFIPGGAGGLDPTAATARTHSQPGIDDGVGGVVEVWPSGLGVAPRMEPSAGSVGRQAVLSFLCTGLPGDRPADTSVVGDRCVPQ